jgi:hypothetical protein
MLAVIVPLVSGAVGGNIAGRVLKRYDLGTVGNSVAGVLGGGIGGQMLAILVPAVGAAASGGADAASILAQVAGGGIGGSVLLVVTGMLKQLMMRGVDVK